MAEILEQLVEEGTKLKEEHEKNKCMYKLFMKIVIVAICTCCLWYVFGRLNEVFNFSENIFISTFSLILYTVISLIIILSNNENKRAKVSELFIVHIIVGSFLLTMNDIPQLKGLILKFLVTFIILFMTMIISKYERKYHITFTIFLMIVALIFYVLGFMTIFSFLKLEYFIFVSSLLFKNTSNLIHKTQINVNELHKSCYRHLKSFYITIIFLYM